MTVRQIEVTRMTATRWKLSDPQSLHSGQR